MARLAEKGDFIKNLGSISNVVVVLVVLAAIYVKMNDAGAVAIFRGSDIYILVGAVLALVVLKIFYSHRNKK